MTDKHAPIFVANEAAKEGTVPGRPLFRTVRELKDHAHLHAAISRSVIGNYDAFFQRPGWCEEDQEIFPGPKGMIAADFNELVIWLRALKIKTKGWRVRLMSNVFGRNQECVQFTRQAAGYTITADFKPGLSLHAVKLQVLELFAGVIGVVPYIATPPPEFDAQAGEPI